TLCCCTMNAKELLPGSRASRERLERHCAFRFRLSPQSLIFGIRPVLPGRFAATAVAAPALTASISAARFARPRAGALVVRDQLPPPTLDGRRHLFEGTAFGRQTVQDPHGRPSLDVTRDDPPRLQVLEAGGECLGPDAVRALLELAEP